MLGELASKFYGPYSLLLVINNITEIVISLIKPSSATG
jgi:hypothetical protein